MGRDRVDKATLPTIEEMAGSISGPWPRDFERAERAIVEAAKAWRRTITHYNVESAAGDLVSAVDNLLKLENE